MLPFTFRSVVNNCGIYFLAPNHADNLMYCMMTRQYAKDEDFKAAKFRLCDDAAKLRKDKNERVKAFVKRERQKKRMQKKLKEAQAQDCGDKQ